MEHNYTEAFDLLIPKKIQELFCSGDYENMRLAWEIGCKLDLALWYFTSVVHCTTYDLAYVLHNHPMQRILLEYLKDFPNAGSLIERLDELSKRIQ